VIRQWLEKNYGIKAEEEIRVGNYLACKRGDQLYFLIHPVKTGQEEILELQTFALHLAKNGDRNVPLFFPGKNGDILNKWENDMACVLVSNRSKAKKVTNLGRKLGKFHNRGRNLDYSIKKVSRLGQWKQIWEKRLDQMEAVWTGRLFQHPENEFEKMFMESFPYYMGLAENAIQYLVDTELDDSPTIVDHGTICHERFSSTTWEEGQLIKNPFEWILDHCARDIAEWTRERYFYNTQTCGPEIRQFFSDYQSSAKLSPFSFRLLFARMLFPLHYFDCVENYYITDSEQQKNVLQDAFLRHLKHSGEYERFLGSFFQLIDVPVRAYNIPEIEWLTRG
jgi:spore coat protein YutH